MVKAVLIGALVLVYLLEIAGFSVSIQNAHFKQ